MLLGNKVDLEIKREVDQESSKNFALNYNLLFKEVSAKTNESECINKAIEELIGEVF